MHNLLHAHKDGPCSGHLYTLSMFTARNYGECVKDFHTLCSQAINTGNMYWAEVIIIIIIIIIIIMIIIYLYKNGLTKRNRSLTEFIFKTVNM